MAHTNIYMAGASGGATSQVNWIYKGLQVISSAPNDSEWFTCFMTGIFSRIGECINQDAEISIELMIEIQRLLELEWNLTVKQNKKEDIRTAAENGSFRIFPCCGILR